VNTNTEVIPRTRSSGQRVSRQLLREVFAAQARLLAARAERDLAIDIRSVGSLVRVFAALLVLGGGKE